MKWSGSVWRPGNSCMNIQPDFEELLQSLEKHHVEYMIVGGYAVAFHGAPRFTKDIDIFYNRNPANIERLRRALGEFGFSENSLPVDLFAEKGSVLTFGVPPVRVDLVNDIDGVTFDEARPNVVRGKYGRADAAFIGRQDVVRHYNSPMQHKHLPVEGPARIQRNVPGQRRQNSLVCRAESNEVSAVFHLEVRETPSIGPHSRSWVGHTVAPLRTAAG